MRRRPRINVNLPGDDLPWVHGTPSCYTNRACRCRECRDAWATYHRERRAKKRAAPREEMTVPPAATWNDA